MLQVWKPCHYFDECGYTKKVCFECIEERYIMKDYPKKKGDARIDMQPKPKAREFQLIIEAAKYDVDVVSGNEG